MKFTDIMLDLETTGRRPGCAIIQISAVLFNANTGAMSIRTFNTPIRLAQQASKGFNVDKNTLIWWASNNSRLYNKLSNSDVFYVDAGRAFQKWFLSLRNHQDIRVWGNSARFDLGILEGWYRKAIGDNFQPFWNTWLERDARTIFQLAPEIRQQIPFEGTKHNAIDDARHQAKAICEIIKRKKLKIN